MITFAEFIKKYQGQGLDWDKAYGRQCMDLYRFYVQEVLNLPQSPPVKGAAWIRFTYDKNLYNWFDNTITAVPKFGDILIWDTRAGGGFGHVAIYIRGNVLYFTSFDLNWPSQGNRDQYGNFIGTGVCHEQGHNYFGGLVGWLRPKVASTPPTTPPMTDSQKLAKIKEIANGAGSGDEKIDKIREILK